MTKQSEAGAIFLYGGLLDGLLQPVTEFPLPAVLELKKHKYNRTDHYHAHFGVRIYLSEHIIGGRYCAKGQP